MPLYEYYCKKCDTSMTAMRTVDDRNNCPECEACGNITDKLISVPNNAYVSGYPYYDQVLDTEVSDPGHRRKLLKEHRLEERG